MKAIKESAETDIIYLIKNNRLPQKELIELNNYGMVGLNLEHKVAISDTITKPSKVVKLETQSTNTSLSQNDISDEDVYILPETEEIKPPMLKVSLLSKSNISSRDLHRLGKKSKSPKITKSVETPEINDINSSYLLPSLNTKKLSISINKVEATDNKPGNRKTRSKRKEDFKDVEVSKAASLGIEDFKVSFIKKGSKKHEVNLEDSLEKNVNPEIKKKDFLPSFDSPELVKKSKISIVLKKN